MKQVDPDKTHLCSFSHAIQLEIKLKIGFEANRIRKKHSIGSFLKMEFRQAGARFAAFHFQ